MPHRRLVKIGVEPTLPTISQFLKEMAARQHEEIQRLKTEALSGTLPDPTVPEADHAELTPDPWQLHPVRITPLRKKASAKKSAKKTKIKPSTAAKSKKVTKKAKKQTPKAKKKTPAKKATRRSKR